MYNIVCKEKFSFDMDIPNFSIRFSRFINSKKKNIIYLKEFFDNSTFRYRAYNIINSMENSDKYLVSCFLIEEIPKLIKYLNKIDLVILQRCKWSFELESFINFVRDSGIRVGYDMDDLIYNPKYVPKYLNNVAYYSEKEIDLHFAMASRYYEIAKIADFYLVTTDALKEKVLSDFDKKSFIYYNFLNKEQEDISNKILEIKNDLYDDSKFVIGYFSGSNSHYRDLGVATNAIIKMLEKYDNVYLMIVGYMNLSEELNYYKSKGRVIVKPFVTYQELQYLIASVDVNIIPLIQNEFNECKSELKYFEASIVNTVSIASNNLVYSAIIKDGENGFLAGTTEWFEKLEYIYLNIDKINDIISNARDFCLDRYGSSKQTERLEKLYDSIIDM